VYTFADLVFTKIVDGRTGGQTDGQSVNYRSPASRYGALINKIWL